MDIINSTHLTNTVDGFDEQRSLNSQPSVFDKLVKNETDVTGLLAYSLHELSIQEWRRNFSDHFLRQPSEDEKDIFMIGETTPRRLSTYHSQAKDMLIVYKSGQDNESGHKIDQNSEHFTEDVLSQNTCRNIEFSHSLEKSNLPENANLPENSSLLKNSWTKGTRAALRLPPDTNLKALGQSILILFVLVGLLAVAVNYTKAKFF